MPPSGYSSANKAIIKGKGKKKEELFKDQALNATFIRMRRVLNLEVIVVL